jgi:Rrf2 family protein
MKLSKKAEYALRALVAMARDTAGRTFSIQEIAAGERIPLKFLEQILLVLKHASVLRSKRGVGGGYQLARPPKRISIADVIDYIDGPAEPIPCAAAAGKPIACECGIVGACALGQSLATLRDQTRAWQSSITIADIVEREHTRSAGTFDI